MSGRIVKERDHDCFLDQTAARPGCGADHSGAAVKPFGFWRDGLFVIGCVAYALNRWLLKPHFRWRFLHWHFNDLWLIPCALPLVLYLHRRLRLRQDRPPTAAEVAGHLVLWSALFEWWGPHLWRSATGDPLDVVCYWVGGVGAWAWWNRAALFPAGQRTDEL